MGGEKHEEERKKKELKISTILTNTALSDVKAMLEKDHAIDCLFLLYLGKGRWGEGKRFLLNLGKHIADGTFRARMKEMVLLNLATQRNIGNQPCKYRYVITDFGMRIVQLLLSFFEGIQRR
jgi:DNA-binding HxlR family transcriptional regulator